MCEPPENPSRANVTLRVDSSTKYMRCRLPSQPNFVNVFLDSKDSETCVVTTSAGEKEGNIFIGRLNLEKLGIKDQFSRLCGILTTLYIVKQSTSTTERKEGEENTVPIIHE